MPYATCAAVAEAHSRAAATPAVVQCTTGHTVSGPLIWILGLQGSASTAMQMMVARFMPEPFDGCTADS